MTLNQQSRVIPCQRGFSLVELLMVIFIVLVLLAMAMPNLLSAQANAREASAAMAMSSIHKGQTIYLIQYGSYAPSLVFLGPPAPGSLPSASAADILDPLLASGFIRGYNVRYQAIDLNHDGLPDAYRVNADGDPGSGVRRFYYVDETGIVRVEILSSATARSKPMGSIGEK